MYIVHCTLYVKQKHSFGIQYTTYISVSHNQIENVVLR